jgi:hypothetical protein
MPTTIVLPRRVAKWDTAAASGPRPLDPVGDPLARLQIGAVVVVDRAHHDRDARRDDLESFPQRALDNAVGQWISSTPAKVISASWQ